MAVSKAAESGQQDNDLIGGFNWDNDSSDFFGIKSEDSETETQTRVIKKVKGEEDDDRNPNPTPVGKKTKKEIKSEEEEQDETEGEHTFFEDTKTKGDKESKGKGTKSEEPENEELETVPTGKGDEPEEQDDKAFYTTLTKELKEKGVFSNIEFKDDDEIDEDRFFELQEEEVDKRVDEVFESFTSELPQDAKDFIKFLRSGGDTNQFLSTYATSSRLPNDLDLDDTKVGLKNANTVLRYYYKEVEQLDDEKDENGESDIDAKLEWVKDRGKTLDYAKKYYKQINDADLKQKEALLKRQEDKQVADKKRAEALRGNLEKVINKGEGEGDVVFSTKDASLINMITKPTIKVAPNRFITEFQSKLSEIMQDEKKMLSLAKILKDEFKVGEGTKKKVNKEVITEVKNSLKDAKSKIRTTGGSSKVEKALSEFF